jgi:hypothetical protein
MLLATSGVSDCLLLDTAPAAAAGWGSGDRPFFSFYFYGAVGAFTPTFSTRRKKKSGGRGLAGPGGGVRGETAIISHHHAAGRGDSGCPDGLGMIAGDCSRSFSRLSALAIRNQTAASRIPSWQSLTGSAITSHYQ